MKRTCERCRALELYQGFCSCRLGYNINQKDIKPEEECPKPLTNKKLIDSDHKR